MFLSHRQQVVATIVLIVVFFAFLARLDLVLGPREWLKDDLVHLPFISISVNWFWMWVVGYPFFAFIFAFSYYAGASDTERNRVYSLGIFLTVILFAIGQLEDFFWHVVNPEIPWLPFGQDWSIWGWSAENNLCWKIFGTWNTEMHLIWLTTFILIVVAMWVIIFEYS